MRLLTQTGLALVLTTVVTAVVHTLIPDHWLPFVLVSRAEGWSVRRTISMTMLSALLHVSLSSALGLVIVGAGLGAEKAVLGLGEALESITGWMLVVFGVAYMLWFLARGGHSHSFGMHPHHRPTDPDPPDEEPHEPHGIAGGHAGHAAHAGHAGLARPEVRARRGRFSGYALTFIVGFNPCILVIPCLYGAAQMSALTLAGVAVAFAVSTVGSMVAVTMLGLKGTARLTSPFLTRYGEAFSGALIALVGAAVLIADH